MSCEACDEREKKIDELLRAVKALKVDISGRSEITLLLQQKYEAEFDLRRKVGGQLAIAVLQNHELRTALEMAHEGYCSHNCSAAAHPDGVHESGCQDIAHVLKVSEKPLCEHTWTETQCSTCGDPKPDYKPKSECPDCHGTGEIGLADGDVWCPKCHPEYYKLKCGCPGTDARSHLTTCAKRTAGVDDGVIEKREEGS